MSKVLDKSYDCNLFQEKWGKSSLEEKYSDVLSQKSYFYSDNGLRRKSNPEYEHVQFLTGFNTLTLWFVTERKSYRKRPELPESMQKLRINLVQTSKNYLETSFLGVVHK